MPTVHRCRQLSSYMMITQTVIVVLLLSKRHFRWFVHEETPFFIKDNFLDCTRIVAGDENYTAEIVKRGRHVMPDFDANALIDCSAIRQRFFFPQQPLSEEEENFPIAFAITVNQLALSAMYSPQNQYCYHVDEKSDQLFKERMQRLAQCWTNVHVADESYVVDSAGQNMSRAFLACLRHLLTKSASWKYALTLQGHDFPLRTNLELVRILKLLNGSNDVELRNGDHRVPKEKSWDFVDLNILPMSKLARGEKTLNITKGSVATSLSRAFVEFVIDSVNSTELLRRLDSVKMSDELFFATINHDLALNAPGGYPGRCLLKTGDRFKPWISRFAVWSGYSLQCHSKKWRHTVCLFGLEDLPVLSSRKELFANKFFPSFDFGAAQCMHELLFNRTYLPLQYELPLDQSYYENMASVKYRRWQSESLPSDQFNCSYCSKCLH